MNHNQATLRSQPAAALPEWASLVVQKVESLRFGAIQIIVHEGRVIQLESTEKIRLQSAH